ncbi:hypothetical protein PkP19E3_23925 [Pseudomonas koreensis]|nr:hypothetical protein PkP19E3_23925 [Pseudomonas koreensis]
MGASLLANAGDPVQICNRVAAFASKLAPTGFGLLFIFRSCDAAHGSGARPGHSRTGTDCAPAP